MGGGGTLADGGREGAGGRREGAEGGREGGGSQGGGGGSDPVLKLKRSSGLNVAPPFCQLRWFFQLRVSPVRAQSFAVC